LVKMQLDLEQLRTLRAVVERGTLDGAAKALHVTPSAVSQRLKALETTAGRVLLVRSKPARPTPAGEAVLRLARQVELLAADTSAELERAGALPRLAVAVNADSLATWFLPAIAPLAGEIAVECHREDETNTARLLKAGTVVAAITTDPEPIAGCTVTPLGAMRYRPMASEAFVRRWLPAGPTAEALAVAPMMVFDRDDPYQHDHLATKAPGADPPQTRVPSSSDFVQAIGLGLGWGMVADLQRAGGPELVELEPGAEREVRLHLQRWRIDTPSLDRLASAIVAGARRSLAE
jgi:LysR family transcriptional regulator (chromosome initiation inhibitor)